MDKTRAMPILASAAIALSLAACQGMGGMGGSQASGSQTSSAPSSTAKASAAMEQQAAAPDLVRDIQRTLGAKGYDAGSPDGIYGNATEQALRKFQHDQKLNSTGQIDAQTLAALGLTGEPQAGQRAATSAYVPTNKRQGAMATVPSNRQTAMNTIRPDREQTRAIQENLASRGYDAGQPDGHWGPRTQQALRDFQRDQNLQVSGRTDPQTLAALGVENGSPATQTGQLPAERRAAPPPADNPADVTAPNPGPVPASPQQQAPLTGEEGR